MIALLMSVAFAQPCTLTSQKLSASDASGGAQFGQAVAMDGPVAVVGAWTKGNGAAYVYRIVNGVWGQEAILLALDGKPADLFGGAVAISGDRIVIGAQDADVPAANAGAAYVYRKVGAVWSQEAKLIAGDGGYGDRFGWSVAIDGTTVVIGANQDDDPGNSGSAYVFELQGAAWVKVQRLVASDRAAYDYFGDSVAVLGTTIAVGCPSRGIDDRGGVYVFTRPSTLWVQQTILLAPDAAPYDQFGGSVDLGPGSLLVGAPGDDDKGIDSGSAYLFSGSPLVMAVKLVAPDGAAGDNLGLAVNLSGADLVAGAFSNGPSGAAYWWRGTDPAIKLLAPDQGINDYFGWGVATSQGHVIAGAHQDDDAGVNCPAPCLSSGSAYVFTCASGPPPGCTSPADCNDNDPCTTDTCTAGVCGHAPLDCGDGNACTADSCGLGGCVHAPVNCDDGSPCTQDSCVPATGCKHCREQCAPCTIGSQCCSGQCDAGMCK